ncbi:hypothetical protein ACFLUU_03575 [Chloroflexota bacterium]
MTVAYAAPGSQAWYLSNESAGYQRWDMYKGDTTRDAGTLEIEQGPNLIWQSDEVASIDVTFASDLWSVVVLTDTAPSTDNMFRGYLGTWDAYGGFVQINWWNWMGDGSTTSFSHSFNPGPFTVPTDHNLAFRLINVGDATNENITVKLGSNFSYVISPTSDPGYPVPELPTLVLGGIGLVVLSAYIWFRRRKLLATTS